MRMISEQISRHGFKLPSLFCLVDIRIFNKSIFFPKLPGKTIIAVKPLLSNLKTIIATGIVDVFMSRNIPDSILMSLDN